MFCKTSITYSKYGLKTERQETHNNIKTESMIKELEKNMSITEKNGIFPIWFSERSLNYYFHFK